MITISSIDSSLLIQDRAERDTSLVNLFYSYVTVRFGLHREAILTQIVSYISDGFLKSLVVREFKHCQFILTTLKEIDHLYQKVKNPLSLEEQAQVKKLYFDKKYSETARESFYMEYFLSKLGSKKWEGRSYAQERISFIPGFFESSRLNLFIINCYFREFKETHLPLEYILESADHVDERKNLFIVLSDMQDKSYLNRALDYMDRHYDIPSKNAIMAALYPDKECERIH